MGISRAVEEVVPQKGEKKSRFALEEWIGIKKDTTLRTENFQIQKSIPVSLELIQSSLQRAFVLSSNSCTAEVSNYSTGH